MARRSLHGRRIFITGASRGVGHELAQHLARFQTHLLIVARSEELLTELAITLKRQGAASVLPMAGDIGDARFRQQLVEKLDQEWRALDILVNNAGVSALGHFTSHNEQVLRKIFEVNFFAATELTRHCLPLLEKGEQPLLVNMGSILGHRGLPYNSEYCASKFALRGWTEAIRPELIAKGIDVLLVSPGTIETEFFDHLLAEADPLPWSKPKGIPPAEVARQVTHAIQNGRREIFPNWRGRVLVMANRWLPGFVDRWMNRYG